jgi:hypothetical protein
MLLNDREVALAKRQGVTAVSIMLIDE